MSSYDSLPLSPLGVMLEPDPKEKHLSHLAADIPHKTPATNPEWAETFTSLYGFATEFQAKLGVAPIDINPDSIRILEQGDMSDAASLLTGSRQHNGGIHDPWSRIVYLEEPRDPDDPMEQIIFHYAAAHELGHHLTPGLDGFDRLAEEAFILSEGIADRFARDYIRGAFLPEQAPEIAALIAQKFVQDRAPYSHRGLELRPDEILFINPASGQEAVLSRIVEMRIVETLELLLGPDGFNELMQQASYGSTPDSRAVIVDRLGVEIWDLIATDPDLKSPVEILEELRELSRLNSLFHD